jgi:hypothetical protein
VHSRSVHQRLLIPNSRKRTKPFMRSPHHVKRRRMALSKRVCSSSSHGVHRLTFPADGTFNPFPNFGFSGLLRPVYPLSPKRVVPDHIPRPDYAEDGSPTILLSRLTSRLNKYFQGIPISETRRAGQPPRILSPEEQQKMRTVCRVGACLTLQA